MTDRIPVRYLPTEEAQVSLGEYRDGDTLPVIHGGTGAVTPEDARNNLGIVDAPGSVTQFSYTLALPPTVTPLTGEVSRDNADPTLTTTLYLHKIDGDVRDQSGFLSSIKVGDWVNLFLQSDANTYERYDATGPAVLTGDVFAVPVSYFDHAAGPLVDDDAVYAYWRVAQEPVAWGEVTGTLADQTDLQAALDGKEPTIDPKNTAFNQSFGTGATDVPTGDHNHSSDNSVLDTVTMTQAEYDALTPPDSATLYLICEATP